MRDAASPEDSQPVRRPEGPVAQGPWASRRKRVIALTVAGLFLLAALGTGLFFALRDPEGNPEAEPQAALPTGDAGPAAEPSPTQRGQAPQESTRSSSSPFAPPSPGPNPFPNVPINPSPAHLYLQIPLATTLRWQGGDPLGELVKYNVLVDGVEKCANTVLEECPIAALTAGQAHTWRVRATDAAGQTILSPEWTFTTNYYPNAASLVSPGNNAENQPLSVTMKWDGSDPDASQDLTHRVLFQASADPTTTDVKCDWSATKECAATGLASLTWYHWQVETKDSQGLTKLGPVWKFKTQDWSQPDPGCPIICPQG